MEKLSNSGYKQILGAWGESQAAEFLTKNGLQIIAKNFRTSQGEIDLIAKEGDVLVFVEVKTRSNLKFGFPEEAVTDKKVEHLLAAAETYLLENLDVQKWRMDVVAVLGKPGLRIPEIKWFTDVR